MDRDFYAVLTLDNLEDVAQRVRELLTGKRYTFASLNDGFNPTSDIGFDVRTDQQIDQRDPVKTWRDDQGQYGGFNVGDTYGVWGANTYDKPQIYISHARMCIMHAAPAGHRLIWKIVIQRD